MITPMTVIHTVHGSLLTAALLLKTGTGDYRHTGPSLFIPLWDVQKSIQEISSVIGSIFDKEAIRPLFPHLTYK